jgi:hypothetical protein
VVSRQSPMHRLHYRPLPLSFCSLLDGAFLIGFRNAEEACAFRPHLDFSIHCCSRAEEVPSPLDTAPRRPSPSAEGTFVPMTHALLRAHYGRVGFVLVCASLSSEWLARTLGADVLEELFDGGYLDMTLQRGRGGVQTAPTGPIFSWAMVDRARETGPKTLLAWR